ncbi:MAG: TetR/AcrR family transcriptional regulator [Blastocatellia bacterium]|nr:TetR/AcrR family transcriptional regulator [Blastocatellia bacterium]MBN8721806.1 TetR/AcrR family transcriptional regulator [Acidobacteriota bacterium]
MSRERTKKDPKNFVDENLSLKSAGRRRCIIAHQNILNAANELLIEVGFSNVTIEGIAQRAGVGKTTIYRRWPNKASVVMDAFLAETAPQFPFPDTGSPLEDFRQQIKLVVKVLNGQGGRTIATLLGGCQTDKELAEAFRSRFLAVRRLESKNVLKKAMEQGKISSNIDVDLLLDVLYAPLYFRLLIGHAPLTDNMVDDLINLVMAHLITEKTN